MIELECPHFKTFLHNRIIHKNIIQSNYEISLLIEIWPPLSLISIEKNN